VLALLGIGTTMVAALTVLPAVLRLTEPRRPTAHPTAARADVTG
jgi:predicted RND superfamily exporter protein